jgi:hypothetical protein
LASLGWIRQVRRAVFFFSVCFGEDRDLRVLMGVWSWFLVLTSGTLVDVSKGLDRDVTSFYDSWLMGIVGSVITCETCARGAEEESQASNRMVKSSIV